MATLNLTLPVPAAPTGLSVTGTVNSAIISWTSTSPTNTYQIYSSTTNDSSTATLEGTSKTNSYTASLTPGQTKYYWVKAVDINGTPSAFSAYSAPTTTLGGTNFNTLYLAFNGEWRGTDDGSYAYRGFNVDQIQVNITYTPSGGGSTSTGWVSFSTTVTQAQGSGTSGSSWSNPNYANASDSQDAGASVQTPGSTWSLMARLGDALVPSTATVTGIQARVTGYVSGGSTAVSEFKNILQIVSGSSTQISTKLGNTKEFTYSAKSTSATITVGGTTDTWGLTSPGTGVPATPSVGVSGAPTASSGSGVYRTLAQVSTYMTAGQTSGRFGFVSGGQAVLDSTGTSAGPMHVMYIDPADFALTGTSTYLRLRVSAGTNNTSPGVSFTFGLSPISRDGAASGTAGNLQYIISAYTSGSSTSSITPAAATETNVVGSDFLIPSAGFYAIVVTSSSVLATSSHVHFTATLQIHNV